MSPASVCLAICLCNIGCSPQAMYNMSNLCIKITLKSARIGHYGRWLLCTDGRQSRAISSHQIVLRTTCIKRPAATEDHFSIHRVVPMKRFTASSPRVVFCSEVLLYFLACMWIHYPSPYELSVGGW